MSNVAKRLISIFTRPDFRYSEDPPEVMTEARCRSVLPNWALASFRKIQGLENSLASHDGDYLADALL